MSYKVFVRNWWRHKDNQPGVLEPDPGATKRHICVAESESDARSICKEYNDSHDPGELSRMAEYTS